jgi:DNA gyrase subunit A
MRTNGLRAYDNAEGDELLTVVLARPHQDVLIVTKQGKSIRFAGDDVRHMGRVARGVRGITLRDGDEVVAMEVVREGGTVLTVTQHGYGKRTELEEYRLQSRGGVGIINIQTSERNGKVVGTAYVHDDDELMLISQQGKILRMVAKDIRSIGRATQGVRLLGVEEGDEVVSVARLAERESEENGGGETAAPEPDTPPEEAPPQ